MGQVTELHSQLCRDGSDKDQHQTLLWHGGFLRAAHPSCPGAAPWHRAHWVSLGRLIPLCLTLPLQAMDGGVLSSSGEKPDGWAAQELNSNLAQNMGTGGRSRK